VPLARDLHPEFGYMGSGPRLWRKVGLVFAFVIFGLFAGVSGLTMFVGTPEPDPLQSGPLQANPLQAMALAPPEALIRLPAASAEGQSDVLPSPRSLKTSRIKPPACREDAMENLGADCTPVKAAKPALAVNERPAIAAIAIGRRDEPALLPLQPATVALPRDKSTVTSEPAAASPVQPLAKPSPPPRPPAPVAKKTRQHSNQVHQARRRENNTVSRSWTYHYGVGYARMW
jgi:hypothetical protein